MHSEQSSSPDGLARPPSAARRRMGWQEPLVFGEVIEIFQGAHAHDLGVVVNTHRFSQKFPLLVRTVLLEQPCGEGWFEDVLALVGQHPTVVTVGRDKLVERLGRLPPAQCAALRAMLDRQFVGLC